MKILLNTEYFILGYDLIIKLYYLLQAILSLDKYQINLLLMTF